MDKHSLAASHEAHLLAKIINRQDELLAKFDALQAAVKLVLPPKPAVLKQASE